MRIAILAAAITLIALPALAQAPVLYASPDDVVAAKAKALPLSTMTPQTLVAVAPYAANLEWRAAPTPANVHETEDEFITVTEGTGTIIVGGTLKGQTRKNATNLLGTSIEGGKSYPLVKGTYFFLPAGTPHQFTVIGAQGLSDVALHVPHIAATPAK
jgi:mannose-6-phosphate isomerase-like protein (cupin superfamily)